MQLVIGHIAFVIDQMIALAAEVADGHHPAALHFLLDIHVPLLHNQQSSMGLKPGEQEASTATPRLGSQ
jgi:hypothetical protein